MLETLSIRKASIPESLIKHLIILDTMYGREFCGFFTGRYKDADRHRMAVQNFSWVDNIKPLETNIIDYQMHPQQMMNVLFTTSAMNPKSNMHPIAVHNHPRSLGIPSEIDKNAFRLGKGLDMPYCILGGADGVPHLWKWDRGLDDFIEVEVEIV